MTTPSITEAATSRFITITNEGQPLRLHYNDVGTGDKVVVMLHGSGAGASGWGNFQRNIEPLANAGYRVILLDLPGWNKSDGYVSQGSRSDFNAKILKEVLVQLGIPKVHIIGNSMGAYSAVGFALAYPQMLGKLVLSSGGTTGQSPLAPAPTEGVKFLRVVYRNPTLENFKNMMNVLVYDSSVLSDDLLKQRLENILSRREHLDNFVKSMDISLKQFSDYSARLSEIQAPAKIFWGTDDRFAPLDMGLRLVTGMPNAELHVFNQCGHWVPWERADSYNRMVQEFLAR